jgi:hypothetical protein
MPTTREANQILDVSFESVPDLSHFPRETKELASALAAAAEILRCIRQQPDERLPVIA